MRSGIKPGGPLFPQHGHQENNWWPFPCGKGRFCSAVGLALGPPWKRKQPQEAPAHRRTLTPQGAHAHAHVCARVRPPVPTPPPGALGDLSPSCLHRTPTMSLRWHVSDLSTRLSPREARAPEPVGPAHRALADTPSFPGSEPWSKFSKHPLENSREGTLGLAGHSAPPAAQLHQRRFMSGCGRAQQSFTEGSGLAHGQRGPAWSRTSHEKTLGGKRAPRCCLAQEPQPLRP